MITRATNELIAINDSSAHPLHAAKSMIAGVQAAADAAASDVVKRRVFGELMADPAPASQRQLADPAPASQRQLAARPKTASEDAFDPAMIDEQRETVGRKTEQQ